MTEKTKAIISVIRSIPPGRVATYGDVAAAAGVPNSARLVVWILKSLSGKEQLPWHRVVNRKGRVAIKDPEGAFLQKGMLQEEGIPVDENGCFELERFRCRLQPE